MPLMMAVNAASPQPNVWPMGPSLIELSAAVRSKIVCCITQVMLFEQHPHFIQRRSRASECRCYFSLSSAKRFVFMVTCNEFQQRQCMIYDRLAVWAHSALFSRLGAASTAAGWCINMLVLRLDR